MSIFRAAAAGAVMVCVALSANAQPGWTITGLTVLPPDAPKLVAALDALFASDVGSKAPGRVVLRANVADGNNPETHTVVSLASSAEEREQFQAKLYASDAWAELTSTVSSLSRAPGVTMRGIIVWNNGDRTDSDVVWLNHYLTTRQPASLAAALAAYSQTPGGQAQTGQVHLSALIAGGVGGPSHVVSVGFASEAEMEASIAKQQQDPAYQAMLGIINSIAQYHGAVLQRDLKSWGKASVEEVTDTGN
jgi:hypothetical protein